MGMQSESRPWETLQCKQPTQITCKGEREKEGERETRDMPTIAM